MSDYTRHLPTIAAEDARFLAERDKSYGSSWKRRGGVGAFMMLARKWDRLEQIVKDYPYPMGTAPKPQSYDIFGCIAARPDVSDGSVLAEVRDLRRYLLLVEAEMVERGVVGGGQEMQEATVAMAEAQMPNTKTLASEVWESVNPQSVPAEDSNRHAPRLRRQQNHKELMDLPREDQLRYRWTEAEQAYVLQPGRVVGDVFLPERVQEEEYKALLQVRTWISGYYTHHNGEYLLLEADNA